MSSVAFRAVFCRFLRVLRLTHPSLSVNTARKYSDKIPEGDPNYKPEEAVYPSRYLADKSIKLLGLTYRSLEEVTKDSLEDFKARGWL